MSYDQYGGAQSSGPVAPPARPYAPAAPSVPPPGHPVSHGQPQQYHQPPHPAVPPMAPYEQQAYGQPGQGQNTGQKETGVASKVEIGVLDWVAFAAVGIGLALVVASYLVDWIVLPGTRHGLGLGDVEDSSQNSIGTWAVLYITTSLLAVLSAAATTAFGVLRGRQPTVHLGLRVGTGVLAVLTVVWWVLIFTIVLNARSQPANPVSFGLGMWLALGAVVACGAAAGLSHKSGGQTPPAGAARHPSPPVQPGGGHHAPPRQPGHQTPPQRYDQPQRPYGASAQPGQYGRPAPAGYGPQPQLGHPAPQQQW